MLVHRRPSLYWWAGKGRNYCEQWSRHHRHRHSPRDPSFIEIYFLDSVENPGSKEDGYPQLMKLEERWMVDLGSLATLDPLKGSNKRDDAAAKAWGT